MSGMPFWMSGSFQETLTDLREWSGVPPGCPCGPPGYPGVVRRSSRMFVSGWEVQTDVQEWSRGPL